MKKFSVKVCPVYAKEVELIIKNLDVPDLVMTLLPYANSLAEDDSCNKSGHENEDNDTLRIGSKAFWSELDFNGNANNCPLMSQTVIDYWLKKGFVVMSSGWFEQNIEQILERSSTNIENERIGSQVLILDSGTNKEIDCNCNKWSQLAKIEVVRLPVGLEFLQLSIEKAYLKFRIQNECKTAEEKNDLIATKAIEPDCTQQNIQLAEIAHDIRNPLNAISGAVQLLNFTQLDTEQESLVNIATEAVQAFLVQMDKLKAFSTNRLSDPTDTQSRVDIKKLFKEILSLYGEQAKVRDVELGFNTSQDLKERYKGDELKIKRILMSLLENALSFFEHVPMTVSCHVLDRLADVIDMLEFRIEIFNFQASQKPQLALAKNQENLTLINYSNLVGIDGSLDVYEQPMGGICYRLTCRLQGE